MPPRPPLARALCLTLLSLGLSAPLTAPAQTDHNAHHATPATPAEPAATAPAALPWVEAEVRRIDEAAGKISLRHGAIPNLDMPPMTMVFQVPDRSLLQRAQPGERVRFTADQVNGQYTVLQLERVQ